MMCVVFKKFIQSLMALCAAAVAFPTLAPACYLGHSSPYAVSAETKYPVVADAGAVPFVTQPHNFDMVPSPRFPSYPSHPLSFRASPPLPAAVSKGTPATSPGFAPAAIPATARVEVKAPTALQKFLRPFASLSAKLRAVDPENILKNIITRCTQWVVWFFGRKALSDSNPQTQQIVDQTIMPILYTGASFAARPIVTMATNHVEALAKKTNGIVNWVGEKAGVSPLQRTSRFIGTFFTEYFIKKLEDATNITALRAPSLAKDDETTHDIIVSRYLILGGSIIHLLGDLHNVLYEHTNPELDRIDAWLKMCKSTTSFAHYTLMVYQKTTAHAQTLSDNMKAFIGGTMTMLNLIKDIETQITAFKQQANQTGMTPVLLNFLSGNEGINAQMPACMNIEALFAQQAEQMAALYGAPTTA